MNTARECPHCGRPVPPGSLDGLCPECLLKVGAAAESAPAPDVGPGGTVVVPPPDAPPLVAPEIGQSFGRYRVLRRLGHGGMGVVYEAEESDSGRRVALKVLNQRLNSPQDRARFLREGRLAAAINHPNCVYVYGTEEIEGTPVITMEFVTGGTLQQRLVKEGPLPIGPAVDAILQIIDGLEAAQSVGILHRDIKPSNCFEDATGLLKIGDFGLSISTLPREDTELTDSGAMLGTPAFCSPEQLRGEELDARTDMYAVGVTLYHLLTGKLPFEGQNMPQLIANTLEKRAASPRRHRKEIPEGLARVILRCLSKQPTERFKTYDDLRNALEPYGSTAPTAATLGLRFLAGMVDAFALSAAGQVAILLVFGDAITALGAMDSLLWLAPWFLAAILYYAVCEWRWGATPGKAVCRVRVIGKDNSPPPARAAFTRAGFYMVIPVLPYWVMTAVNPATSPLSGEPLSIWMGLAYYVVLAGLFATARRHNGYAAVHDLLTGTRVVSRAAMARRPSLPLEAPRPDRVEDKPRIGPYHVLEPLGHSAAAEWTMGYDLRLLRRVLIRRVPPGTPPLPSSLKHLSRPGRLRWLTGRRQGSENWDAFEGAEGRPLLTLADRPQPWAQVRFWLNDLTTELAAADRDGTTPEALSVDRVWITTQGRAKLLDFPAPGAIESIPDESGRSASSRSPNDRATRFLREVALTALGGRKADKETRTQLPVRLALHARKFLDSMSDLQGVEAVAAALRPVLRRTSEVTRARRALLVAGCLVMPVFMSAGAMFGLSLLNGLRQEEPGLMELGTLLDTWRTVHMAWMPAEKLPTDEQLGIYIAAHFQEVITNETVWAGPAATLFIRHDGRRFAENSLARYASATPEQRADAEAALKPIVEYRGLGRSAEGGGFNQMNLMEMPGAVILIFWIMLLAYVALPAILAAVLFRGGLVLLATGVTYVRRDGRRASRLRLFWRSALSWTPVLAGLALCLAGLDRGSVVLQAMSGVLAAGLAAWSLLLPERGLQDRLSGTWPVPR